MYAHLKGTRKPWIELREVDKERSQQWERALNIRKYGLRELSMHCISQEETEQRVAAMGAIRTCFQKELYSVRSERVKSPYLFSLADAQGYCIDQVGPLELIGHLNGQGIGLGTSYRMDHAGINAISVAMELGTTAVVRGREHSLDAFSKWSCVCVPIFLDNQVAAYLNMSLSASDEIGYSSVMLSQYIACNIERLAFEMDPNVRRQQIYARMNKYGLTHREKEIGYLWMNNCSVDDISSLLIIAGGTVRGTLKKIYRKAQVTDKGQFITKFLSEKHPFWDIYPNEKCKYD